MQISGDNKSSPSLVRAFLRADSAEMLVRLQLELNVALLGRADFTDIQFADGYWYAWFLIDVDQNPEIIEGIMNGTISSPRRQRAK